MRKLGALIVVVVVALTVAAPSYAGRSKPDVINDPAFYDDLNQLVHGTGYNTHYTPGNQGALFSAADYGDSTSLGIRATLEKAAGVQGGTGARGIGMGLAGRASVIGGYLYVGYSVGTVIDHWFGISQWIGGNTTGVIAANYDKLDFVLVDCTNSTTGTFARTGTTTSFLSSDGTNNYGTTQTNMCSAIANAGGTFPASGWLAYAHRVSSAFWESPILCTGTCAAIPVTQADKQAAYFRAFAASNPDAHIDDHFYGSNEAVTLYYLPGELEKHQARNSASTGVNPGGSHIDTLPVAHKPEDGTGCGYATSCGVSVRNIILGDTNTTNYIVHLFDPTDYPTDPIATKTVPSCAGSSEATCTAAYASAGFINSPSYVVASFAQADESKAASAIIAQSPTVATQAVSTATITVTENPAAAAMPMTLPKPFTYETYGDYTDRLAALGFLGTITEHDLASGSGENSAGADGVPRVRINLGTDLSATMVYRNAWPSPSPKVGVSAAIEIWRNPSDAPTVPGEDPPEAPPGAPGAIDFGPITSLDPGCKFPYGFVCYAQEVTGWFDVTPHAPEFDFSIPGFNVAGTTLGPSSYDYNVDLSNMDDYMSLIRGLISVALWVGAVYLIATRLLGFHAGGDPGEAADEGLVV